MLGGTGRGRETHSFMDRPIPLEKPHALFFCPRAEAVYADANPSWCVLIAGDFEGSKTLNPKNIACGGGGGVRNHSSVEDRTAQPSTANSRTAHPAIRRGKAQPVYR